ncbi:NAD-dependent succinate-semialdehyde dehydrogenase [Paenibacillus sp. J31TS4]|uniref:NAD-dependent succinate-semialdehyde dehydrogenase n=1 Tax=Paenibacillus sp. J31TS4 TaxID=2807195 RepID=UPI001AFED3BB|nr:NAD-dependent succinate-semialdehyde dehydrogenase [Paenibacillus sp. J31TS4]GIP40051.1 NAD-dependent succinate-semialdehyde dehydrogenase [Paenibacillus sp. J31TS4]
MGEPITKGIYIGGEWKEAVRGGTIDVFNPATLEKLATVPDAGDDEAAQAVDAASSALPAWREASAYERAALLMRWYEQIMLHQEEIARTMTMEQGKPLPEARTEVAYAASFIQWYAEEAKRVYGEIIPATTAGKRLFVIRQAVGVVGAITPWNFPAAMITRKAGPALAAGCTIVVKPAEQTPLTALLLAEMAEKAGIPAGVLNVITGDAKTIAGRLMADGRVRKVTFTGSTEVGKEIMRGAADTMKKISLELGGHAPVIVFDDADLELAAEQTAISKFRNAGQTCVCANRIYVHESVHDAFERRLADKIAGLRVGYGLDEGVAIGPLIDESGLDKVKRQVEEAVARGAKAVVGGRTAEPEGSRRGFFYEPTLLTGVTPDMQIMREETFGPVAPLIPFRTDEEAVRMANDSVYGLAAYLFTTNVNRAVRAAEGLEYGIVGVNDGAPSTAQAPFGGFKESGLGREGGRQGIEEYLETKYISLGLG